MEMGLGFMKREKGLGKSDLALYPNHSSLTPHPFSLIPFPSPQPIRLTQQLLIFSDAPESEYQKEDDEEGKNGA